MVEALAILLEFARSLLFTGVRLAASLYAASLAFNAARHLGVSENAGLWWALAVFGIVCITISLFEAALELDLDEVEP